MLGCRLRVLGSPAWFRRMPFDWRPPWICFFHDNAPVPPHPAGQKCYAEISLMSIEITLPDGSKQSFPPRTRPIDIAQSISPRLADAAIVARVNDELYDLTRPLEKDAALQILTNKDPEALEVYRHSTAHLLAAAVLELYPETQLGIGPPIDTGFYYDFDRATPFTLEDLEKIEKKMWEIQARNLPYDRIYTKKDEGLKKYSD